MGTVKNYLFIALSLVALIACTSCQSEEEMENNILDGYCWEGQLPIYNYGNEYYSRFYFESDGSGVEEVYINGRHDSDYPFTWGWINGYYSVMQLKYGSRWNVSYSCINVIQVKDGVLTGYFYEDIQDFYYEYENGTSTSYTDRYVRLTAKTGVHRYNN